MKDSRIYTTPLSSAIGGGIAFGLTKAFKANKGLVITFTIIGAVIGGVAGYIR